MPTNVTVKVLFDSRIPFSIFGRVFFHMGKVFKDPFVIVRFSECIAISPNKSCHWMSSSNDKRAFCILQLHKKFP